MRVKVLKNGVELQRMVFDSAEVKADWIAHLQTGQSAWGDFSQLTIVEEDMSAEKDALQKQRDDSKAIRNQAHQILVKLKKSDLTDVSTLADTVLHLINYLELQNQSLPVLAQPIPKRGFFARLFKGK